jgi:hypothetical protein
MNAMNRRDLFRTALIGTLGAAGAGAAGELPDFREKPGPYSGPHRANGVYVIRFRNLAKGPQQPNFIRGYGFKGNASQRSVTDPFCQLHDVTNVLVTDGACFVSSGCQNPTLTMMAITVRACDHLLERFKRGEV